MMLVALDNLSIFIAKTVLPMPCTLSKIYRNLITSRATTLTCETVATTVVTATTVMATSANCRVELIFGEKGERGFGERMMH